MDLAGINSLAPIGSFVRHSITETCVNAIEFKSIKNNINRYFMDYIFTNFE
jgi:hypothetical protein